MLLRQFVDQARIPFAEFLIPFKGAEAEVVDHPLLVADQCIFSQNPEKAFELWYLLKQLFLFFSAEQLNNRIRGDFDEKLSRLSGEERV